MSQKISEKVRRKKMMGNISEKISWKKSQNPLNFGEKIPESREKLPGFSNPKNLRTLFFRVIYPSDIRIQMHAIIREL
jgi:hypothetical protein